MASSPLVDLSAVLQNLFLGGNKSTGETSTSRSSAAPNVIANLETILAEAVSNSNNPAAVQPVVDKIIKDATEAFAPQLAREAGAGMYNSQTRKLLAGKAAGEAAGATSSAILNYKTGQQQIATQAGNALVNATKTVANTGAQQAKVSPGIPGGISGLAAGGLGLYSLYKRKDDLVDWLTGGSSGGATGGALPAWADITASPDLFQAVMGQAPAGFSFAGGQFLPEAAASAYSDLLTPFDFLSGGSGTAAGGGAVVNILDSVDEFVPFDFGSAGISVLEQGTEIAGDLFSGLGDAVDITGLLGGAGDFIGGIFDEILSFF